MMQNGTVAQVDPYWVTSGASFMNLYEVTLHGTESIYLLAASKYRALELVGDYFADAGQRTMLNNGKFVVPTKPSAVVTVTKDNVKAAIVDSGYYPASDFTGL